VALIGTSQAAEQYGVSDQTIRNWGKRGLIKLYRFGPHMLRVEEAELAGLMTEVVA